MDIKGFYINLDRSTERRAAMEEALQRVGLADRISRFSALQPDDRPAGISRSELGCFLSHRAVLDLADPQIPTVIFEDDVVFPEYFRRNLRMLLSTLPNQNCDLLFLNQMIAFTDMRSVYTLLNLKRQMGDIHDPGHDRFITRDAKGYFVSGTSAYIIMPGAAPRLAAVLRKAAAAGYQLPVDVAYKVGIMSGEISGRFVFPYLVGVAMDIESTVAPHKDIENKPLFVDILNLFVAGGDIRPLEAKVDQLLEEPRDRDSLIAAMILYRRLRRPPE